MRGTGLEMVKISVRGQTDQCACHGPQPFVHHDRTQLLTPRPSALTSLPQTRRLPLYTATSLILIACLASALLLYPAKVFHTARTWTLDPCLSSGDKKSSLLDRRFLAHIEGMRQKWDIAGMVVTMVASPKYTGAGWEQDIWGFGEASADGVEVTPEVSAYSSLWRRRGMRGGFDRLQSRPAPRHYGYRRVLL
jgi:hypothetical protein